MAATKLGMCTRALCRRIPDSFAGAALRMAEASSPIDMALVRRQHDKYVDTLRSLGLQVLLLDADEAHPDCCFVEDTAVCIDRTALITFPGHDSRVGETAAVERALVDLAGMRVVRMKRPARMDGGDVLFTGSRLYVGLSKRTNAAGAQSLQLTFPHIPVTTVPLACGLHLKCFASMCGPDSVAVADNDAGRALLAAMNAAEPGRYRPVVLPDASAANCLFVNGALVHRAATEYPASVRKLSQVAAKRVELESGEIEKADGLLTCCSILLA